MQKSKKIVNLLIILLLIICGIVLAWFEDYLKLFSVEFWIFSHIIVISSLIIGYFMIKIKQLLRLCIIYSIVGYITQLVGVNSNFWSYEKETFYFTIFLFPIVGVVLWGLTKGIYLLFRRINLQRIFNFLILIFIFGLLILEILRLKLKPCIYFYIYYIFLFLADLFICKKINFAEFISCIISAMLMGNIAERLGERSNLWSFHQDVWIFLPFCCWVLEFLFVFGIARGLQTISKN